MVVLLLVVLDVGQAQLTFSLPGKWGSGRKRSELTPINVDRLIANRRLGLSGDPSRNWVASDNNVVDGGSSDDDDLEQSQAESSMTMNDEEVWLKRTPSSEGYFDEDDDGKDHHRHVKRMRGLVKTDSSRPGSPDNNIETGLPRETKQREVNFIIVCMTI